MSAIIMKIHSSIRNFRKSALLIVFALVATGASTWADAQQAAQLRIRSYNSNVKGIWIQNENNPNGWMCFPLTSPGETPGPGVLIGSKFSAYALSSTECANGGQRIQNMYSKNYTVPDTNRVVIAITATKLYFNP
ncbi:hypothetical protein [Xanthomonas albilineans]|uniref:hypothetical protein n=1 Tax=Xanthomonas albilineans TaxID=29447 RepID=UPI00209E9BB4|nr:hypothetical protein [Xanthomonas albilineans]